MGQSAALLIPEPNLTNGPISPHLSFGVAVSYRADQPAEQRRRVTGAVWRMLPPREICSITNTAEGRRLNPQKKVLRPGPAGQSG